MRTLILIFAVVSALVAFPVTVQLTDGTAVTTDTSQVSMKGAWYTNAEGVRSFAPKASIKMLTFPPNPEAAVRVPTTHKDKVPPAPAPVAAAEHPEPDPKREEGTVLSMSEIRERMKTPEERKRFLGLLDAYISGGPITPEWEAYRTACLEAYDATVRGELDLEQMRAKCWQAQQAAIGLEFAKKLPWIRPLTIAPRFKDGFDP